MATKENTRERPKGLAPDEMKVHGREACLQLFAKRPDSVVRVYFVEAKAKHFSALVKWCVEKHRAYHAVHPNELESISGSVHHEGICVVTKALPSISLDEALAKADGPLVWLDGVQNPQNIGAILRSAAHFGVAYLLGEPTVVTRLLPSAVRIAEGAAEWVRLVPVAPTPAAWQAIKAAGYATVATSSRKGQPLYQYRMPPKTLFLLGGEAKGLSPAALQKADQVVQIPGTGQVESLNVGVAAALCLGEYWRQHHGRRR